MSDIVLNPTVQTINITRAQSPVDVARIVATVSVASGDNEVSVTPATVIALVQPISPTVTITETPTPEIKIQRLGIPGPVGPQGAPSTIPGPQGPQGPAGQDGNAIIPETIHGGFF